MKQPKVITISQLITLLKKLKEKDKLFAACSYDANCAWTDITGIRDIYIGDDGKKYLRLQGD